MSADSLNAPRFCPETEKDLADEERRLAEGLLFEEWMEGRPLSVVLHVCALRELHDEGDPTAALEAISALGARRMNDGALRSNKYPSWLDEAVKLALFNAVRSHNDSIRGAFGVPAGRGKPSLGEIQFRRYQEGLAHAMAEGINEGRRRAGIQYPRGEDRYSLAAAALPELEWTRDNVEKWCAKSRKRGGKSAWGSFARTIYAKTVARIVRAGAFPPWGKPGNK